MNPVMNRTEAVTLLLARFEDLVRLGLQALIADDPNLQIVAEDVSAEAMRAALVEHRPRVAILNFGSLRTSVEVNRLASAHEGTRLLVLANRPTPAEANQMLSFGATACLSKETQARDILNAIHLASRGLQVLPRCGTPSHPEPPGPQVLTPREAEVLDHLRAGASNAQIAQELYVSIETVRTHARSVFRKLGVASRRELRGLGR